MLHNNKEHYLNLHDQLIYRMDKIHLKDKAAKYFHFFVNTQIEICINGPNAGGTTSHTPFVPSTSVKSHGRELEPLCEVYVYIRHTKK